MVKKPTYQELERRVEELGNIAHELAESEEQFRLVAENISEIFYIKDLRTGSYTYLSPAFEKVYGLSREKAYEDPNYFFNELVHPEDHARVFAAIKAQDEGKKYFNQEYRVIRPDGILKWVWVRSFPIDAPDSQLKRIVGITVDITERKQAQDRIEHLNLTLRAIRNVNQLITKEKDQDRLLKGICDNLTESRGYDSAWIALLDESGKSVTHVEAGLGKDFLPMVERLKLGELPRCTRQVFEQSGVLVIKDPALTCTDCPLSDRYTENTALSARLEYGGNIYGLLSASTVTAFVTDEETGLFQEVANDIAFALRNMELEELRKKAEESLKESFEYFQMVTSNITVAVWSADIGEDGAFGNTYTSTVFDELLGLPAGTLNSDWNKYFSYIKPEYMERINIAFGKAIESPGAIIESEFEVVKGNGQTAWFYSRGRCFENNGKLHVFGSTEDITERKQVEEKLRKSEGSLGEAQRIAHLGNWDWDIANDTLVWSDEFYRIFGLKPQEFGATYEAFLNSVHPDDRAFVDKSVNEALSENKLYGIEHRIVRPDGSVRTIWEDGEVTFDDGGKPIKMVGTGQDITERKQVERILQQSEERWRSLVKNAPQIIMLVDRDRRIQFINHVVAGLDVKDVIGSSIYDYIQPVSHDITKGIVDRVFETGEPGYYEINGVGPDGRISWYETRTAAIKIGEKVDNVIQITSDVTERKQAETAMNESLVEKETLLKEVHHRVKNNMQVISSLLRMQAGKVKDKDVLAMLKDSQNRIQSMALVYNKLYQSQNLASINMADYIKELTTGLIKSYTTSPSRVTASIDPSDVSLGIDMAIPCVLVINELVINSLKYAFPENRTGQIAISLKEDGNQELELVVSDNGVGIPEGINLANTSTLGLKLVTNLVENQLDGKIELDRTQGTTFKITIRREEEKK